MKSKWKNKDAIIPCTRGEEINSLIENYAKELEEAAPFIGTHGLDPEEFGSRGIFTAAIEKLRGRQSASMGEKQKFISEVLDYIQKKGEINSWRFTGHGERHDYEVILKDGRVSIIEAKGCLDGNNTTIYQRPPGADEFFLWSLCQNAGSDPGHNAWSGIHTRLGPKILVDKEQVDGLVIWDMLCGNKERFCPKVGADKSRLVMLDSGRLVPPPCIYLFPRSIPDPRNNPNPKTKNLSEVGFLKALHDIFGGEEGEIISVSIEARMKEVNVQRRTNIIKNGGVVGQSRWTTIKRAVR